MDDYQEFEGKVTTLCLSRPTPDSGLGWFQILFGSKATSCINHMLHPEQSKLDREFQKLFINSENICLLLACSLACQLACQLACSIHCSFAHLPALSLSFGFATSLICHFVTCIVACSLFAFVFLLLICFVVCLFAYVIYVGGFGWFLRPTSQTGSLCDMIWRFSPCHLSSVASAWTWMIWMIIRNLKERSPLSACHVQLLIQV